MQLITNLRTIIASLLILALGCLLLILSEWLKFRDGYFWIRSLLSNFGGLLVASISIALLWELFSKRSFLNELIETTGLVDDLKTVGVTGISVDPLRGPPFSRLISEAERLDIFVCYANTWRANFDRELKILAKKRNARVRLIVPDPTHPEIMADLASRFGIADAVVMANTITQAISEYKKLFLSCGNPSLNFTVWMHHETPVSSFYRFDRCAVITLYKHSKGRGNAPTITATRGGSLYAYIESEVDSMVKGTGGPTGHPPLAVQVYPQLAAATTQFFPVLLSP